MTSVRGGGSEVTERADEEFEVTNPGVQPEEPPAPRAEPPEHTQRIPTEEWATRSLPAIPGGDAVAAVGPGAASRARGSRLGAVLFWMAVGWWLFAAVRLADAVARISYTDGALRPVSGATLRDAARAATTSGRSELLALVLLSVLAAVVLLVSRGRRGLGVLALALAAAAAGLAGWQLLS